MARSFSSSDKPKNRLPGLQHLIGEQLAIGKVQDRVKILHIVLGEDVVFLGEGGFHRLRRCGHRGAGIGADDLHQRRVQHVVHGEEDDVSGFLRCFS